MMPKLTGIEKECIRFYLKLWSDKADWEYGDTLWLVSCVKAGKILDHTPFDRPSPDYTGLALICDDYEVYRRAILDHPWVDRVKMSRYKRDWAEVESLCEGRSHREWRAEFEEIRDRSYRGMSS